MPSVPRPGRPRRPARPRRPGRSARIGSGTSRGAARIVVLGDLMLDMVVVPARPLEPGTDVPGRVALVQGGSAANTARWLGRLGAQTSLIAAVGRDAAGRALVDAIRTDRVTAPHLARGRGTDRADRGHRRARRRAQLRGRPRRRRPARGGRPPGRLVRAVRTRSICPPTRCSVSRSERPAGGRSSSRATRTRRSASTSRRSGPCWPAAGERRADLSRRPRRTCCSRPRPKPRRSSADAHSTGCSTSPPIVVVKRGAKGATVLARVGSERIRLEVATEHLTATDTTGAGDAFDAGFLVGWFASRRAGRSVPARSSARRSPVIGQPHASSRRRGPSLRSGPALADAARRRCSGARRRRCSDDHRPARHQPRGLGRARRGPAGRRPRIRR